MTPPAELEGAVGPTFEQTPRHDDHEVGAAIPLRATFFPLQLFPSQQGRHFDVGAGWEFVPLFDRPFIHGPHLEAAYLTTRHVPDVLDFFGPEPGTTRLGFHVKGQGLFAAESDQPISPGVTLQISLESVGFTDTDFMGCQDNQSDDDPADNWEDDEDESVVCGTGYAFGETGGGFFIEGSYGRIDQRNLWWIGLGLKVRIPATMGVGFVVGDF